MDKKPLTATDIAAAWRRLDTPPPGQPFYPWRFNGIDYLTSTDWSDPSHPVTRIRLVPRVRNAWPEEGC